MRTFILLVLFALVILRSFAQSPSNSLDGARKADSLMWDAYNHCDVAGMKTYFAGDVEFYHDKGGTTLGANELAASFTNGPCSNTDSFIMRRAAVNNTANIYPLEKNGQLYGAVISGEHIFYVAEKGKKEKADGQAKFTTLWLLENNAWKMKRVLSYGHQPAPYKNESKTVTVSSATLKQYTGRYQGRKMGLMQVQSAKGYLIISSGNAKFVAYPSSNTLFFVKERDLTFEFDKKPAGIMDVIVRENGNIVETFTAAKR